MLHPSPFILLYSQAFADRNIISGNAGKGVMVSGDNAAANTIQNNYIGTNAAGTGALGNQHGILVHVPAHATATVVDINHDLISGNRGDGIRFEGSGGTNQKGTTAAYTGTVGDSLATAMPPDVRWWLRPTVSSLLDFGATPPFLGQSPQEIKEDLAGRAQPIRTSGGEAVTSVRGATNGFLSAPLTRSLPLPILYGSASALPGPLVPLPGGVVVSKPGFCYIGPEIIAFVGVVDHNQPASVWFENRFQLEKCFGEIILFGHKR